MSELKGPYSRFELNDMVRLRAEPSLVGVVREILALEGSGYQYKVFFSIDDQRYVNEADLQPLVETLLEEVTFRVRRHLDDLRREILLAKLKTPYGENLFSLRASRVEFHPYQFKPVLKLLYRPDHRLLIADEVGLGKTIEAGIIMSELHARLDLRRVLVICPGSLRIKWRDEMRSRFEEHFELLDAPRLRDFFGDYSRMGMATRKKGIVSLELIRRPEFLERIATEAVHFDLVVIDEAHHCRNRDSRAFELATLISDNADALLLLTATPLHLGKPDLFNLLQIVSPGLFEAFETFEDQVEPNRYINLASRLVQANRPDEALLTLREIESTSQRERYLADPYYLEITELLERSELDRELAVRIQRGLLELNSLAHVYTRTRKREVMEHAPVREAHTVRFDFSDQEREFYEGTVRFVRQHWQHTRQHPGALGFALVTRERQAASCLPAFRDHYASGMVQLYATPEDLSMVEGLVGDGDGDETQEFPEAIQTAARQLGEAARNLGHTDTKFKAFLSVLKTVLDEEPDAKVLVFSFFKRTLDYLHQKLRVEGIDAFHIHGDIDVFARSGIVEQFQSSDGARVLLSSEVGSEGLDFQFCHVVFNYDLPWNPMKVEQRIGRVDRFGQLSQKIAIYNFIAAGTIEDRIFSRLYARIRIFEEAIGDLEAILGEVMRDLTQQLYTKELSPEQEEQLADQAANAILLGRHQMEEFEEVKNEFIGQDAILQQDVRSAEASGRFVSPEEIRALVTSYLASAFPGSQLRDNDGDRTWYMVPDSDFVQAMHTHVYKKERTDLSHQQFLERLRAGKLMPITFSDDIAYERKLVEFLTIRHPITRAAISFWDENSPGGPPVLVVHLNGRDVVAGTFYFFVFILRNEGIRIEEKLIPVLISADSHQVVKDASEEFLRIIQTGEGAGPGEMHELSEAEYQSAHDVAVKHMGTFRAEVEEDTRKLNDARVNARRFAILQTFDAKIRRVAESLERVRERRIQRMRSAQLENLKAARRASIEEIESRRDVSVTYTLDISGLVVITAKE